MRAHLALWLAAGTALAGCRSGGEGPRLAARPMESEREREERMEWWRDARFGLFIHWGLYAVPAGEWNGAVNHGEWIRDTARIPLEQYEEFRGTFNPVNFDAQAWVRMAKAAGMKYIVITSKHHDGFCLFDSALTDWDVMSTPFKRDVMAELAEAARSQGLQIGWYYSIMDWHHPDYLPRRGWEAASRPADGTDMDRYVQYMHGQVEELLTEYGPVGVMWFDGEWEETWTHDRGVELYELCRRLQPDVIINNRVDVHRGGMAGLTASGVEAVGDFGTPEQEVPPTGLPGVDWETCMTMNDHWGFNRADGDYKSSRELIRTLVDVASKGGNFLLNVGPTAEGEFPPEAVERLEAIGRWMEVNGEAIYGTSGSPFDGLSWGRCTVRDGRTSTVYLHVFEWPATREIVLEGLSNQVRGGRLLADPGAPVDVRQSRGRTVVRVPASPPDADCSVVALDVAGPLVVYSPPRIDAASEVFHELIEVRLSGAADGTTIRYTLDGSEPTADSVRYSGPIAIDRDTVVSARVFKAGNPVSGTTRRAFRVAELLPRATEPAGPEGLWVHTYRGTWSGLPDFATLEPTRTTAVEAEAVTGLINEENSGHVVEGWFVVPEDDVYRVVLGSDDGSRVYIDGQLIVDNDGMHTHVEKDGMVGLQGGKHAIRIEHFNRSGQGTLVVKIGPLGGEARPLAELTPTRRDIETP